MGKRKKTPMVGENRNDPYVASHREDGMKVPTPPKTIKVLAEEILPKRWAFILIISMLPIINLIAFMAWKNKRNYGTNPNLRTYASAALIVYLVLYLLIAIAAIVYFFVIAKGVAV